MYLNKNNLDFDNVENAIPVQEISLEKEKAVKGQMVQLKLAKFKNISNITVCGFHGEI